MTINEFRHIRTESLAEAASLPTASSGLIDDILSEEEVVNKSGI